jgi:5-methylcytosine-specific restriction enzyme A
MAFRDVTREAVLAAIEEYDELGQDDFLSKYGFDRARAYLLVHDSKAYDSKAIVGAAHRFLPGERALAASEFSGGDATVGRLLRRLGFTVQVGELTASRLVGLLNKLDVYRVDGIPALYQPITLLWAFSRASRSEPRMAGWEETGRSVRDLVERFGRPGERPNVHYPLAALHRAGLWELDAEPQTAPSAHGSSAPQRWFDEHQPRGGLVTSVYELIRDSVRARDAGVDALVDAYFVDADPGKLLDELGLLREPDVPEVSVAEMEFADRTARYKDLCERVDIYWSGGRGSRHEASLSARLRRSAAAREAVLLRSRGRCENPCCAGDVQDVTDSGVPILEVDHVRDLAKGGPDRPVQMIALCPNCHATKTRGRTRQQLQQELFTVAEQRHQALLAGHLQALGAAAQFR